MLDKSIFEGMDVNIKSQTANKIEYIVANPDRFGAKDAIEKRAAANGLDYKDGVKSSSSIDLKTTDIIVENVTYRIYYKPRAGGGSGAGAEVTALGECFQAYASAARQVKRKDLQVAEEVFDILDASTIRLNVDADRTLKQCKAGLDPMWMYSGQAIANKLARYLGTGEYVFHRGSPEVTAIEKEYQRLKKIAGITFDINKWNPSDIWAIKKNFNLQTSFETLTDFNQYLLDQHKARNVVGVSLKKLANQSSTPSEEVYNSGAVKKDAKFVGFRINARGKDFFEKRQEIPVGGNFIQKTIIKEINKRIPDKYTLSKDAYITYKEGTTTKEMQLRTFSAGMSGWQGEIKGSSAAGGKIGGGNLQQALVLAGIDKRDFIDQSIFKEKARSRRKQTLEEFTKFYKYLSKDRRSEQELYVEIEQLVMSFDSNWFYSKYLSMQFLYVMLSKNKQDDVISTLVSIASSSTPISSIFVKYS